MLPLGFIMFVGCIHDAPQDRESPRSETEDSSHHGDSDTDTDTDTGTPGVVVPAVVVWEGGDGVPSAARLGMSLASGRNLPPLLVLAAPSIGEDNGFENFYESEIKVLGSATGESGDAVFTLFGSFTNADDRNINTRLGTEVLLPGDVTGDGEPDIVAFNDPVDCDLPEPAYLFPGPFDDRGLARVMDPSVIPIGGPDSWWGTPCGDLDGNGIEDLCLASGIVFGPIDKYPTPTVTWSTADAISARIASADLDCDGTNDLLLWDSSTTSVRRIKAFPSGDLDLSTAAATWSAEGGAATAIAAGSDLDGDGRPDFVVAWTDGVTSRVFVINETRGGLLADARTVMDIPATALGTGDSDGDGFADLAIGGEGSVWLFRGPLQAGLLDGGDAAAHWIGEQYPDDLFGHAIIAADLDGDDRDEWVVGAPDYVSKGFESWPRGRVYVISGEGE